MGRSWTIMVYLAGDNNLSEEMIYAIKEMYRIGVNDKFSVIVRFDPSGIGSQINQFVIGDRVKIRKALGLKGNPQDSGMDVDGKLIDLGSASAMGSPIRISAPNENSADPKTLLKFILSSQNSYKADHYMVILSGHGNGVRGNFMTDINSRGQRTSTTIPSSLSLTGLKWVFDQVYKKRKKPIDILGLDCCQMSMGEIACQLEGTVNYMIGAEGTEFNTGWPYQRLLSQFRKGVEASANWINMPREMAARAVKDYILYYQDYEVTGMSTDQAALDLTGGKCKTLVEAVKRLADELIKRIKEVDVQDSILLAHWRAQSYADEDYVDLWDFCDQLARRRQGNDSIGKACEIVKTSIEGKDGEGMVVKSCYSGTAFQHSHGLSVYFPWKDNEFLHLPGPKELKNLKSRKKPRYEYLDFAQKTRWAEFLREYINLTRREVRPGEQPLLKYRAPDNALVLVRRDAWGTTRGAEYKQNPMKNSAIEFFRCRTD